jgi:hypothetical protein
MTVKKGILTVLHATHLFSWSKYSYAFCDQYRVVQDVRHGDVAYQNIADSETDNGGIAQLRCAADSCPNMKFAGMSSIKFSNIIRKLIGPKGWWIAACYWKQRGASFIIGDVRLRRLWGRRTSSKRNIGRRTSSREGNLPSLANFSSTVPG